MKSAELYRLLLSVILFLAATRPVFSNDPPILTNLNDTKAQLWNAGFTVIDTNASITDVDSSNLANGLLIVRVINGLASDRLSIKSSPAAGQINVIGNDVRLGTTSIGTLLSSIPVSGATLLRVKLKAVTPAVATQLLRKITYRNVTSSEHTANRTIRFTISDGDGGTSPAVNKIIRVGALSGAYAGTFSGSVDDFFGNHFIIPGPIVPDNSVDVDIVNTLATVFLPGLGAAAGGTGTITSSGAFSAGTVGTIAGLGVQVTFTGSFKLNANGSATGTGTWMIVNTPGLTGSGTWGLLRP